jgi:hypothetical protein
MSDRILTPVIALGLAFLVWMYTRSRNQEILDRYEVPVELELAAGQADWYELEIKDSPLVPVSFSGPPSRIRELRGLLQQGRVRIQRTINIPEDRLEEARISEVLRFEASELPTLPGINAMIVENQNRVAITLRRIVEKRMPVRLNHTAGERVGPVTVEPATVLVRGPKETLERHEFIETQLYTVPPNSSTPETRVTETIEGLPLVKELSGRLVRLEPERVSVRFTLRPRQKMHELSDVPVHFLCPPNFPYRPQFRSEREGRVALKVLGPATEDHPAVSAYVDLTTRKFGPGLHPEEPLRVQLPPGYRLAQDPPRLASFQLIPLETPMKPAGSLIPDP